MRRRAVVYLTWGSWKNREVIRSIESSVLPYDTFWVTDSPPASVPEGVEVVPAEFKKTAGCLPKAELGRFLPEGYASYLYLDSDTVVLGDIVLGFELAERDGLAMVPAVLYSLADYPRGRELMRELGIAEKGQMNYNAGVIFMAATPEVRLLLADWADLAERFSSRCQSDQLTLALALERAGFQPTALSPSFNCRGYGERLIGEVRIWHHGGPVPRDINRNPGVDRRVVRGRTRTWDGVKWLRTPYPWTRSRGD